MWGSNALCAYGSCGKVKAITKGLNVNQYYKFIQLVVIDRKVRAALSLCVNVSKPF
jgi:hypothetical protein